ncbi:ImmA/IrrE family metallo-endopeptidase [Macrococcus brunensis]|uniref:ImmA/IrrE family metallo-endopeptidase n=1 Tax=Macrococcus brunensis TaxID=198483 RepID=UPI001EEFEBD4|nr:ImmA/IrrE family metallo-endopeptidase [Macrococcus brunensis]ULG73020.1 ImmA/IrrE family metallo-endopeptidase [Macrococcus brunensis]
MKLRIGHIKYKVIERKKPKLDDGTECAGLIDYYEHEILLMKSLSKEHKKKTLAHEIVHGLLHESGFESDDNDGIHTEDNVNRIGLTLHGFLKDNIEELYKLYKE